MTAFRITLTGIIIALAMVWFVVCAFGQMPPPAPQPLTNIVHRVFVPPTPTTITLSCHYTRLSFPVESSTNCGVTWQHETNVCDFEIRATLAKDSDFKMYRMGGPTYSGTWWDVPMTNDIVINDTNNTVVQTSPVGGTNQP